VPDHPVVHALLAELGEPLMSSTLILPNEALPLADAGEIRTRLEHELDLVIDAGPCGLEPTTVVALEDGAARVLRQGKGDPVPFQI
jgi:tRNA A37 threonylcarbamoyladenosine synthetase subunit TsaC/SUA5/YrdC